MERVAAEYRDEEPKAIDFFHTKGSKRPFFGFYLTGETKLVIVDFIVSKK
jgi:hypothetical protein